LAEAQRVSHTGSWAFDLAGEKYVYVSEECRRIFGVDAQNGLPTREEIRRKIHPDDWGAVQEDYERLLRERLDATSEFRIVLPGGTRHIQVIRHPVLNVAGDVVRIVGTAIDMTDRKRAEAERERLRQLEADLRHLNRVSMMGELAASVAHEVNQPLAGIVSNGSACLRWLAGDKFNVEEVREAIRDIVRDGKRAGEIITRIRALATKRPAPRKEELDLNETITEVLALAGDEAKNRRVMLRTQFADDLFPVRGDRVQLQQVALNLILNAFEAMSGITDRPRELVITTRNINTAEVQVTVDDSGPGLDPNTMDKIFKSFYTTKPSGMGMGLSISRSIIEAHGGRLWAACKDGPGAMFHFTLPK
jgi:PAS domain S-box-containing protein